MDTNRIFLNAQRDYIAWGDVNFDSDDAGNGMRGSICDFSDSSRQRLCRAIRNAVCDYHVFGTLTYPPGFGEDGIVVKRDLDVFLKRLRRLQVAEVTDAGVPVGHDLRPWSILWWQEWQGNGRIHFHFAGTHFIDKAWLSQNWFEVVGSWNPKHLAAGTNILELRGGREGVARYAAKYMSKREQKVAPAGWEQVGRFWGISGDRRSVSASTSLEPWHATDSCMANALDDLIIEIEEGIIEGELEELPVPDSEIRMRHWRIIDQKRGDAIRAHVRHIAFQKEAMDALKTPPANQEEICFFGRHTTHYYHEDHC